MVKGREGKENSSVKTDSETLLLFTSYRMMNERLVDILQ